MVDPMGQQIQPFNASTSREIDAVFTSFVRERPDALFVAGDELFCQPAGATCQPDGASCDFRGVFGRVTLPKSAD